MIENKNSEKPVFTWPFVTLITVMCGTLVALCWIGKELLS